MLHDLTYGNDAHCRIDLPRERVVADCTRLRAMPLSDTAAAVVDALAAPLDFLPLVQMIVPGDRVVLALARRVPQAGRIVAAIVNTLIVGGTNPDNITLVLSDEEPPTCSSATDALPESVRGAIHIVRHDPTCREALAYLAVSRSARPIYMNREIHDADVVIPIGAVRPEEALDYVGMHGGLFPTFSDSDTQQRFSKTASLMRPQKRRRRRAEAEEVAWLLGVQFTVQVVPGPDDSVLHVLAGEVQSVARRGRELCEKVWHYRVPQRASLVVAAVEGGPREQTWENFSRALFAASRAVKDDGAIVLCTQIADAPGPALRSITAHATPEGSVPSHHVNGSAESLSATLVAQARARVRVYLLSQLEGQLVEEMGLAHVSDPEEIVRLSGQYDSCILLANAQHAVPTVEEE